MGRETSKRAADYQLRKGGMFLGHFGLAFAAKRLAPRTSLGTLGAASQWVDLVWPVLVLAGIEQVRIAPGDTAYTPLAFVHYPWTHSLVMSLAWGLFLGARLPARQRAIGSGALGGGRLVASHWVLDCLTHRPDLPARSLGARAGRPRPVEPRRGDGAHRRARSSREASCSTRRARVR